MTDTATQFQAKSFDVPDQAFPVGDLARVEIVHLGPTAVHRATFEPGFRWTEHVRPLVGTDLCEIPHTGYVISGRLNVLMADGTEREMAPGDAFVIPGQGHDIWVVGDEPSVLLDFPPEAASHA